MIYGAMIYVIYNFALRHYCTSPCSKHEHINTKSIDRLIHLELSSETFYWNLAKLNSIQLSLQKVGSEYETGTGSGICVCMSSSLLYGFYTVHLTRDISTQKG